jgi:2-(1,2-epoxy-1,2-dihydrophenyl)acetyl-CoA isomerase
MQLQGQFTGFDVNLREPGIVWIVFNRPDSFNGLIAGMRRDLVEVLYRAQMDADARVLVFTGAGDAFCAGDDVRHAHDRALWKGTVTNSLYDNRRMDEIGLYGALRLVSQRVPQAIRDLDLITISAINGVCIQSGLSIALASDFRVAARTAKLACGTLRFGFLPDENGHFLLVQHLGIAKALDFLLNNRFVSGEQAAELGLVHEAVEPEALESHVMEMAVRLANGPQVAMRLLKRAVYNAAQMTLEQAGDDIATKTAISDHHPDATEGMLAWREKRPPRFNRPADRNGPKYRPGRGMAAD